MNPLLCLHPVCSAVFQQKSCTVFRCFFLPLKTQPHLRHASFEVFKPGSSLKDRVVAAVIRKWVSSFSSGNKSAGPPVPGGMLCSWKWYAGKKGAAWQIALSLGEIQSKECFSLVLGNGWSI